MAARKSRPVLYELIAQAQAGSWTGGPRNTPTAKTPAPTPATTPPRTETRGEPISSTLSRWFSGRPPVALSTPYLIAYAIAAIALISLAYYAGRLSKSETPNGSAALEQAFTQKPSEPVVVDERQRGEPSTTHRPTRPVAIPPRPDQPAPEPSRDERVVPPTAAPADVPAKPDDSARAQAFESGKSYVIVQHLSKRGPGPQAAERIRDYLIAGGVPCVVHAGSADLVVVATDSFAIDPKKRKDAADPERKRAQQLMDKIRKLGEQYVTNGYTFKDCYLREF